MAIEVHIEQLRSLSAQTPEAGAEFGKATLVIVTKVLLVLPSQRTTEAASEAKAEAYMMALEDVPYWAVEAAARKWFRNDCGVDERGRPFDYQWAPSPGPLRRIAQLEAGRLLERIVVLERLLHAVEFVDSAAELTAGRAAWRGLWKTVGAHRNVKELTFQAAVKLGSERAARDEGVGVGADDRTKPDLPDPQEHHSKDVAAWRLQCKSHRQLTTHITLFSYKARVGAMRSSSADGCWQPPKPSVFGGKHTTIRLSTGK
jgi:hypothetical protein